MRCRRGSLVGHRAAPPPWGDEDFSNSKAGAAHKTICSWTLSEYLEAIGRETSEANEPS